MDAWPVPDEHPGVPMLFVGDQVLVGSYDIPNRLPELTEIEPVVQLWLFYDSHCDSCTALKEEILPPILARYADRKANTG